MPTDAGRSDHHFGGQDQCFAGLNCREEATMNTITRLLLAGGLCLIAPFGADCDDKKAVPQTSVSLVTSDVSAEKAAAWGAEVVRAVAASEPEITKRHAAHLSTRMGNIEG